MPGGLFLGVGGTVAPPPPPPVPLERLRLLWHGWDGSLWDFSDASAGVQMRTWPVGLKTPENVQWYSSESASVDGQEDTGFRLPARDVVWPLVVFGTAEDPDWVSLDSAFWRTLQPGRFGSWETIHPSGSSRRLQLRLNSGTLDAAGKNPSLAGFANYGVRLLAPDPYWRGSTITRTWTQGSTTDFFNGGSLAPPFHIGEGATISSATITNPGDVDTWPVWTVFGACTSVDLGLNGKLIEAHFTVASGEALVVDTDPRRQTAFLCDAPSGVVDLASGVEVTGDLGATDFAPIPAGQSVVLSLTMVGTGSVSAAIVPGYFEAY